MRSSNFLSDHLIVVRACSVELVAVVAELVMVLVLLGLLQLGAEFDGVGCDHVLLCVCGVLKCASRVDCIGLGCQPVSLYLWLV